MSDGTDATIPQRKTSTAQTARWRALNTERSRAQSRSTSARYRLNQSLRVALYEIERNAQRRGTR